MRFRFDARTSRGSLQEHTVYYLLLEQDGITGIGECAPLTGLSPEKDNIEEHLAAAIAFFRKQDIPAALSAFLPHLPAAWPSSVVFGLETAFLDWQAKGSKLLLPGPFTQGQLCLPINGLVWMAEKEVMRQQIEAKVTQGFQCLKLKIGGIAFDEECALQAYIRERYPEKQLTIRLDANGAFSPDEALSKLECLSAYGVHSVEQPIKAGQWTEMARICAGSPVPVALDEELIGINGRSRKEELLDTIRPQFIILKPTLMGGMQSCREWIELAEERQIGWWFTSALESNIGLNAVSQLAATYAPLLPQGLGTGQLYHNNVPCPLEVSKGQICYNTSTPWILQPVLDAALLGL